MTSVSDYRAAQADAIRDEKTFQDKVLKAARAAGWVTYHTYDSRRSTAGFPDIVMINNGPWRVDRPLVFAELKVGRNKLSRAQEFWAGLLRGIASIPGSPVAYHAWWPIDLIDGTIHQALTGQAP